MRHKYDKELFTHTPGGDLPSIVVAESENLQSKFVVQKVLELREQGVPLNTIAVLFRSGYLSFDLEIELNKANIPFVKFGGFKFIETAHIKDMVAYLRVLDNPRDAVAWNRILLLVDGVGPRTAEKVIDDVLARRVSTGTGGTTTTLPSFWAGFTGYPDRVRELFDALSGASPSHIAPAEKVQGLLNYYEPLFKRRYDDYTKRRKDLDMFQQITERYRSLGTLLADLALDPASESVSDIAPPGTDDEKLVLSTIHSAKGLEWHSVFVIYALDGRFPASRAAMSDEAMEEERRLMYVASTRARDELYISYPIYMFDRSMGHVMGRVSRFLEDLDPKVLPTAMLQEAEDDPA